MKGTGRSCGRVSELSQQTQHLSLRLPLVGGFSGRVSAPRSRCIKELLLLFVALLRCSVHSDQSCRLEKSHRAQSSTLPANVSERL